MISLTDKAAAEIRKMQERMEACGKGFRIDIVPGGCQGYSYEFGFDGEREGDIKSLSGGVTVLAGSEAAGRLDGMTVDFVSYMSG